MKIFLDYIIVNSAKLCEYRKASVNLSWMFKTLKFVVSKLWVINKKQFPVDCIMLASKRDCSQVVFTGATRHFSVLKEAGLNC